MKYLLLLFISVSSFAQGDKFVFEKRKLHNIPNSTDNYQRKIIDDRSCDEISSFVNTPYSVVEFCVASLIQGNTNWEKVVWKDPASGKHYADNLDGYLNRIKIISVIPLAERYYKNGADKEIAEISVYIVIQDKQNLSYVRGTTEVINCVKEDGQWKIIRLPG